MPELSIRTAESADVPLLKQCIESAYSVYKDNIPDLPNVSDGLSSSMVGKSVWVAELKGMVVGVMILKPTSDFLILENVAVRPEASGSGVGKALISKAEAECVRLELSEIRLSTHTDMVGNINLYKHLGWRVLSVEGTKVRMTKSSE